VIVEPCRRRSRAAVIVAALLLGLPGLAGAQAAAPAAAAVRSSEIPMTEVQLAALGVRVAAPLPAAEAGTLRFPARVMVPPTAERAVVAPLAGTVEQLLVSAGDTVRVGQPLAMLFSAELSTLKAGYVQMQAAERLARADLDRDTALHADGIIAARRMEETRGRHQVAAAQLDETRQRLRLAGVGDAELSGKAGAAMSAAMTLRAPQDGVVLAQAAQVGERVEAGTLLFRVAKLDRLWLDVQVPVEAAARLKAGDTLRLKAPPPPACARCRCRFSAAAATAASSRVR
jgi:cobalt-zinc-cadmium efflux system membrane fusion protein